MNTFVIIYCSSNFTEYVNTFSFFLVPTLLNRKYIFYTIGRHNSLWLDNGLHNSLLYVPSYAAGIFLSMHHNVDVEVIQLTADFAHQSKACALGCRPNQACGAKESWRCVAALVLYSVAWPLFRKSNKDMAKSSSTC